MSAHFGLILHVQVGNNDLGAEFNDPNSQASYTWVAYKDGSLDQFCDAAAHAWAQAQGNDTYNSVGTQGFPPEPLTEAACATIAALYRWGHDTYGWPYHLAEVPGEPGFGWHGMGGNAWGGHPNCPGDIRRGQRQHILDLAQGQTPAPPDQGGIVGAQEVQQVQQAIESAVAQAVAQITGTIHGTEFVLFKVPVVAPPADRPDIKAGDLALCASNGVVFWWVEDPATLADDYSVWPELGITFKDHVSMDPVAVDKRGLPTGFGAPLANTRTAALLGITA